MSLFTSQTNLVHGGCAGAPLTLNFGPRCKGGQADRDVAGHAWVTLAGQPYHEDGENYQDFVTMLRFPNT